MPVKAPGQARADGHRRTGVRSDPSLQLRNGAVQLRAASLLRASHEIVADLADLRRDPTLRLGEVVMRAQPLHVCDHARPSCVDLSLKLADVFLHRVTPPPPMAFEPN